MSIENSCPRCYVGAVDQGTSSSRFLIFDVESGELIVQHQVPVKQDFPQQGWVEEDPFELLRTVELCIDEAVKKLQKNKLDPSWIKGIGITNQRETLIVWDRKTGQPLHPAIVWLDNRTAETVDNMCKDSGEQSKYKYQKVCGLPISTYFTALKLRWLMDHDAAIEQSVQEGRCYVGTVDTWLLWNLTGGVNGGLYYTDVTNASRTMFMNLKTLQWDPEICGAFGVPILMLPTIKSSAEVYGNLQSTALKGRPIAAILGDQQAALVGQMCLKKGMAKNTYGTGCFLLLNVGNEPAFSANGLLTTVAFKFGDQKACYALEGSVAVAGAAVQWLRDNLGIINTAADIESLALAVPSSEDCYFVPAFSGLLCPYWQPDARGIICGLTQRTNKSHIARACLDAVCLQTQELLEVMDMDGRLGLPELLVDGGMCDNSLLMQLQADILGIPIQRPLMVETTALGVAMAAAIALDLRTIDNLPTLKRHTFKPRLDEVERRSRILRWKDAVKRSLHWDINKVSYDLQTTAGQ